MDDLVTDEQRLLFDVAMRFATDTYPIASVRVHAIADTAVEVAYRRAAADLGWLSMLVPESSGDTAVSGGGVVNAALVAFARGRTLQPLSFVDANVVAYALAIAGDSVQQAAVSAELRAGRAAAAWVIGAPDLYGPRWSVRAELSGRGFTLTGTATFVPDANTASWLLVTAGSDAGCVQFLVDPSHPGITVRAQQSLDISRRYAEVQFDQVVVESSALVGTAENSSRLVDRQLALACVLHAAESVGAMRSDVDMAVQYAKDRIAFGRPIGSFQAVKHLLADTSLLLETSVAVTVAAAEALEEADDFGIEAASIAKSVVGDASIEAAQNCFQVFGGIGFTWEHDQHLFLRRLTSDAATYGSPEWHRERTCQLAGLEPQGSR